MNHTTADYLQSLINDLATLKTNLAAKGVEVTEDDDFTSLAAKVPMITSGAFKVASIAERDAIQYKREGDICLVMTEDAYTPVPTTLPITANSIIQFKQTITLSQEPQGWSGLFLISSGSDSLNMMYQPSYTEGEPGNITVNAGPYTFRYLTEDGLTFTLEDADVPTYIPVNDLTYSAGEQLYLDFMNLTEYTQGQYLGLYTYKNNTWIGVDFGDDTTAADVLSGKKFVKSTGLVTGTFPDFHTQRDVQLLINYLNQTIYLPVDASNYFVGYSKNAFVFNVNASQTTNAANIFKNCSNIKELDLSTWTGATRIANYNYAFSGMSSLEYLKLPASSTALTGNTSMFPSNLKRLYARSFNWGNLSNGYFSYITSLESIDLQSGFCSQSYGRINTLFKNLTNLKEVNLQSFRITGNYRRLLNSMFENCTSLETVNMRYFNGGSLIDSLSSLFYNCSNLTNVDLTGASFSTYYGSGLTGMFQGCSSLQTLTIGNIIGASNSLINVSNNFKDCTSLTNLDINSFNLYNKTNVYTSLFQNCSSLPSLDLHSWTALPVTATDMFNGCTSLQSLDIRNFDFSNCTTFTGMFGIEDNNTDTRVPANCLIIVKDQTAKDWITTNFTWLTNVQTVAEYEASLEGGE